MQRRRKKYRCDQNFLSACNDWKQISEITKQYFACQFLVSAKSFVSWKYLEDKRKSGNFCQDAMIVNAVLKSLMHLKTTWMILKMSSKMSCVRLCSRRIWTGWVILRTTTSTLWQLCVIPGSAIKTSTFWSDYDTVHNRGAFKLDFWKNLGFCPNQVDPPPPPKVGAPKTKKKKSFFAF